VLKSLETPDTYIVKNGKLTDKQKLENCAIIKFCCNLGRTPTKIFEKNQKVNRENKISQSLVFKWHKKLSDGLL
jgi:hypothetical protein